MIGNSIGTDPAELAGQVSPTARSWEILGQIAHRLNDLDKVATGLKQQLADLRSDGVYDAEPTPSWEQRNGNGRYLRLVFPTEDAGGRRRTYIGNDPDKIARTLACVERTRLHRLTRNRLVQLTDYVGHVARGLDDISADLARLVHTFGQT